MKILLDECVPEDFRKQLPGFDPHTVGWAGFKGLKNGKLLSAAELAGYDVMITLDAGIPHEQDWRKRIISLIVLRVESNKLAKLLPLIPCVISALATIEPGQVVFIP